MRRRTRLPFPLLAVAVCAIAWVSSGTVSGNQLVDNLQYGIAELCVTGDNDVVITDDPAATVHCHMWDQ